MRGLSKKLFTCTLIFSMLLSQSIACTAITLVDKKGDVVSGRTMEWALNWDWQLLYNPKNTQHYLTAPSNLDLPEHQYKSKYSILVTGLSKNG
ncbi:linear amide C-N hydrolase, partial [Facilibium subflavum]|uniref:linear amide C-N hydrolase n=1 Tax=Facilibium subflavum TaxID=2219058 RepID=UPI000E654128